MEKIPKLDGTNYSTWKYQVECIFIKENLWSHITGAESYESLAPIEKKVWAIADRLVQCMLLKLIENRLYPLINDCETAKATWQKLYDVYGKLTLPAKVKTWQRICEMRYCNREDIKQHISEMESLFEKLPMVEPELRVTLLLQSLPEPFTLLIKKLSVLPGAELTFELVKSRVIEEKPLLFSHFSRGDVAKQAWK